MPTQTVNIDARINTINSVLTDSDQQHAVEQELQAANGDWPAALASLKSKLPPDSLQKVDFANSLAVWAEDHIPVVSVLAGQPGLTSLRDVALQFNVEKLTELVDPHIVPEDVPGNTPGEKEKNFAATLQHRLFTAEPTAVLQRMVQDAEVPIADANLRTGVANFLNNQPDFNIRTTSIYSALQQPEAFKGIADDQRAGVVEHLKTLQRVQAISPVPEAVPALMKANVTSAFRVAELTESAFLRAFSSSLGEDTARQVYTSAINAQIRNEHALTTMRQTMRGTGLAIIDGKQTREERINALQTVADQNAVPLNLSTLFGSMDFCECDDCLSVYSPASYFVELLQFLRNNDLGPDPATVDPATVDPYPNNNKNIHAGIVGTPLEKLFCRRPDLGCLELTCENTFTVLPYIDLCNEIMESFVVHLGDYHKDTNDPKQATLEVFNVLDETSGELLAIPQHVNYEAYCNLKSAVYPFTLPYHQPIDATRIFLNYMGTSRWELLDIFRTPTESCPGSPLTPEQLNELQTLHQNVIDRAVDAEFLGMTQEEYIILTHEAFWPKSYFDLTQNTVFSVTDYQQKIGVRQVCEYYGYVLTAKGTCDTDMLSTDETSQTGLTFVKKKFLPRTGIQYTDLVELLKTRFINPNFLLGQALAILESIRFSYRFLQTLVDTASADPFAKLIDFLQQAKVWAPALEALLHPDPCHQQQMKCDTISSEDLRLWVLCYFDRIGKLIVLESGQGPELIVTFRKSKDFPYATVPLEGSLVDSNSPATTYLIHSDGVISTNEGQKFAQVNVDLSVVDMNGKPLPGNFRVFTKINVSEMWVATINNGKLSGAVEQSTVTWSAVRDTCELDPVRLRHLDGTPLVSEEYDRLQRFIRLWRKLGWTIDEVDKALAGYDANQSTGGGAAAGGSGGSGDISGKACEYAGYDTFVDDCLTSVGNGDGCGGGGSPEGCPDPIVIAADIKPDFLHQLRAIMKLLDQTGLPLPKLLAFWADISTDGDTSLYSTLFLTHNLLSIDNVFKADANGNYLTQPAKITDHLPVLMAAFKLKADDITAIMNFANVTDSLTIKNISILYRYSLLAKILSLRIPLLQDVINNNLFGNAFKSAWDTLKLLETWGKMEDAGFTFRQIDYLILGNDDPLRPLAPSLKTTLQLAKTLYDGLNAIDLLHPDITMDHEDDATDDLVRAKAGLLFEATVVEQIIGLLEGTSIYINSAPPGLSISVPDTDTLSKKLKYSEQKNVTPLTASIQVTGILTAAEITQAKALSNNPVWQKAIDCANNQSKNVFNDALSGIFTDTANAQKILLAGDVNNPTNAQDPANTAPDKRFYFLQVFLPFLREQLSQRLIIDTSSSSAGLPSDVTNELLSDILTVGTHQVSAMKALEAIKIKPLGTPVGWQGYLIPSVDAVFTFVAIGDIQPPPLTLDGQSISFSVQQECPPNVWSSGTPTKLTSGKLYRLQVADRSAEELLWRTPTSPSTKIPTSTLLPDYSHQGTSDVFIKLYKAALVISGFNLGVDEVSYWQSNAADFDGFDFNAVTMQHWKRLQAYTDLRNNLPRTETSLIELFKWAGKPDDPTKLSEEIAAATTWNKDSTDKLLAPDANDPNDHFDLNRPEAFRNEINLVKLSRAIGVADKIAVDIDRLFEWAKPGSKFWACHQIAEDIRKTLRARFDEEDWEQVVKPLNDQLREHQKQALIDYLVVQPDLIAWGNGVLDADSLFEFFLIDVQMEPCMETSRMVQAIASVQLFVQRCMLGLEENFGVPNDTLDRGRWDWMQQYRVWEANRKVFLYPENWIVSQLRDDKSPFYKELESELLQKDINTQNMQDALKNYLFKVDEVAHLQVVGLFLEQKNDSKGNQIPVRLHVFGRTHNAPYFFYYRFFDMQESNWYPWEKMQVDIPSYDVAKAAFEQVTGNGTYLTPVVWNNRLLIFFPQISVKTKPKSTNNSITGTVKDGVFNAVDNTPITYCEIKLAWSEYRNGKWTQKQVSKDSLIDEGITQVPPTNYSFVPVNHTDQIRINVCYMLGAGQDGISPVGAFRFIGSQLFVDVADNVLTATLPDYFHFFSSKEQIHSLQVDSGSRPEWIQQAPYFEASDNTQYQFSVQINGSAHNFYHPYAHDLLGRVNGDSLDSLFGYYQDPTVAAVDMAEAFGDDTIAKYDELKRSYSIYNWELGFHAPMQLVDRMLNAQQFEQALKMCQYILSPFAAGLPTDDKRFWQFPPFKEIKSENVLQNLFFGLLPGQPDSRINEWRNKPFQPHVVARSRPAAYMMWVAMTYIKILIAWGDFLFRQDTRETINQATQLYVLAAHTYGPRGQKIPKRGKVLPETYNSLLDKWDAFGNAMVELELAFPFSNQTPLPIGMSNGVVGLANIFGFATTLYFCIPDNPDLTALRDLIDDRLFKIRHCENIEGVFQQLPLFQPPIDPALLVQAAAQGLSLSSVLNDLNSPMPNYRFYYLLQKALEVCNELKSLGNAFLSAKEKGDGEALSRLRATHESSIQNLVMEVRKLQVDEAQKSLDALQQSRLGPKSRMEYYVKLIGEDTGKIPDANTDFSELLNQIEQPVDESGLKLIQYEKEEMNKAHEAADWQVGIGVVETLGSILHLIPEFEAAAEPFGVGAGITIGGTNLGNACQAIARGLQIYANHLSYQSTSASRKGGFLRQLQDRINQANIAGFEIKNIDKQMLTHQIRINIANQEITNQQKQIDNAQEVEDFLRSKYTNQELYAWMESQVRALYYQAYTIAYDFAKRSEKVFLFERGQTTSNFIQFGYWDPAYDGLLAGERLYIGLKQLEAAYQEKRGHDFEITKSISLRQINPLELIKLKETGTCEFALPEVLFDMDYPGHYLRRVKSVSFRIPCTIGPYTSLNCTLRLQEHSFRTNAIVAGKGDYPRHTDDTDDRFSTCNVPITSIAVSSLEDESGVFELNFHDERYLPFEGAGAISKWRIELPDPKWFSQFDYDTIMDIIIRLRYTAVDGGDKLKSAAADMVQAYIKSVEDLSKEEGLFAVFDLKNDFPNEWYTANHPPAGATERVLTIEKLNEKLPVFTKGRLAKNIQAVDVYLYVSGSLSATSISANQGGLDFTLTLEGGSSVGTMKTYVAKDVNAAMDEIKITIPDTTTVIDKMWLLERYVLT
jgi:DNA-binding transcriptional MerR regulator